MTDVIDELICGDDVNLIYGDNWYFKMAVSYLSHTKHTEGSSTPIDKKAHISLTITQLKDAAWVKWDL